MISCMAATDGRCTETRPIISEARNSPTAFSRMILARSTPPATAVEACTATGTNSSMNPVLQLVGDGGEFGHFPGDRLQFRFIQLLHDVGGIVRLQNQEKTRQLLQLGQLGILRRCLARLLFDGIHSFFL